MNYKIALGGSKEETIAFCVEHFISKAEEALKDHPYFAVALSGGTTPKAIFEGLAKEENRKRVPWEHTLLFWSDERCVPPDHPDSNYRMAMTALAPIKIPPENIFRMHGEDPPETAAKNYELLLQKELPFLCFDLMMLGMGEDGHTASLFPGTEALHTEGRMVAANYLPEKKTWRLTLTYDCINNSSNIAIYVLGKGKADILSRVLNGPYMPETYPVQKVGNQALFIVDSDAASEL